MTTAFILFHRELSRLRGGVSLAASKLAFQRTQDPYVAVALILPSSAPTPRAPLASIPTRFWHG